MPGEFATSAGFSESWTRSSKWFKYFLVYNNNARTYCLDRADASAHIASDSESYEVEAELVPHSWDVIGHTYRLRQ